MFKCYVDVVCCIGSLEKEGEAVTVHEVVVCCIGSLENAEHYCAVS